MKRNLDETRRCLLDESFNFESSAWPTSAAQMESARNRYRLLTKQMYRRESITSFVVAFGLLSIASCLAVHLHGTGSVSDFVEAEIFATLLVGAAVMMTHGRRADGEHSFFEELSVEEYKELKQRADEGSALGHKLARVRLERPLRKGDGHAATVWLSKQAKLEEEKSALAEEAAQHLRQLLH